MKMFDAFEHGDVDRDRKLFWSIIYQITLV